MSSRHLGVPAHQYYDGHFKRAAIKLLPGEFMATGQGMLLVTVLGSCVAACLRDSVAGVAGMNHFMLPDGGDGVSARYGVHAMELLINDMLKLGAQRSRLEAKVFGAGNVLDGMAVTRIGDRNAEFVRQYLAAERIPISAEDLCGEVARKVYFFCDSGKVMVKKITPTHVQEVVQEEVRYLRGALASNSKAGEVNLF